MIIEAGKELAHFVAEAFPEGSEFCERLHLADDFRAALPFTLPATEPPSLCPDEMRQCAVNAAVAAPQVSCILLGGEFAESFEEAPVGPPIEGYELGNFLQGHWRTSS